MDTVKRDKIVDISIIISVLILLFYIIPHYITITEEDTLASLNQNFFPKITAWLIGGLALMHLILTFKNGKTPDTQEEVEAWLSSKEEYKVYVTALLIMGYVFAMNYLGFILSTIFALALLFILQGVRGVFKVTLISVTVTLGVYFLFLYLLKVHFPIGLIFG